MLKFRKGSAVFGTAVNPDSGLCGIRFLFVGREEEGRGPEGFFGVPAVGTAVLKNKSKKGK